MEQENKLVQAALSKEEKATAARTMTPATNGSKNNKTTAFTKAILDPETREWSRMEPEKQQLNQLVSTHTHTLWEKP